MGSTVNTNQQDHMNLSKAYLSQRWEPIFFIVLFALLSLQVFLFVNNTISVPSSAGSGVAAFVAFELFVARYLSLVTVPLILLPLLALALLGSQQWWTRRFLDLAGIYVVARMLIQLLGVNILVFNSVTPGFILITQLLFFLPYSMLVWGWIYWRLDALIGPKKRRWFLLDGEQDIQRPIDYILASFASVFSASISGIKGRSARAKIIILVHGFFIYDLVGLILSRTVALIQSK